MKKIYLLYLICSTLILGQKEIRFEFDYAQFKFDSTSNYLEIYYSIMPSDFELVKVESTYLIKGKMNIQIQKKETNELVVNKDWGLSQEHKDSLEYMNGKALLGVVGFKLKRGDYSIDISVEDLNNQNQFKNYNEKISVTPFHRKTYSISDIEFATRILNENTNTNSIFYKNTLEVYPNPSLVFNQTAPVMFYYSELYDLDKTESENLKLTKTLFNSNNAKIYETSKKITSRSESIVEVGIVNLKKYPTDTYTFVLSIIDENTKEFSSTSKKFYLVNPGVGLANSTNLAKSSFMGSEFSVLSENECDDLFEKSKIIALGEEIEEYELLKSVEDKREYLFNYWKKRDNSNSTLENEFKKTYFTRIELANKRYRTFSSKGFKTDRGRVFVKFGEPDEIERHPNETNSKPYEVWYYHQIEGGVYFIFGDYTGFNYYELLHSTKRGEMQDPQWARRLQTK